MSHSVWSPIVALLALLQAGVQPIELRHPPALDDCLKKLAFESPLRVVEERNPFYLRGDFNADAKPDYVVVVQVLKTKREALLICEGGDRPVLLGVDPKQAFAPNSFIAKDWQVMTVRQVRELTAFTSNVPRPVVDQRGEAIAMVFEDAVELVYWNGRQYRHVPASF